MRVNAVQAGGGRRRDLEKERKRPATRMPGIRKDDVGWESSGSGSTARFIRLRARTQNMKLHVKRKLITQVTGRALFVSRRVGVLSVGAASLYLHTHTRQCRQLVVK